MAEDIDIRPVLVDKLVAFTDQALEQRMARIVVLREEYQQRVVEQKEALERSERIFRFIEEEGEKAKLAQALKCGDVVRVVCPTCNGSGLKPVDATSGRIQRKSAFETIGKEPTQANPADIDPTERCVDCEGKRWILMDRFKG